MINKKQEKLGSPKDTNLIVHVSSTTKPMFYMTKVSGIEDD